MLYITLHKQNDPISFLIKLQTRSEYSHAGIILNNYLYEAKPLIGVRKTHISKIDLTNVDLYSVKKSVKEHILYRFLEMQLGKRYDYRSVLRFVTRKPANRNNKYFCSELVFEGLNIGGVKLLNNIEAHHVPPFFLSLSPLTEKVDHAIV